MRGYSHTVQKVDKDLICIAEGQRFAVPIHTVLEIMGVEGLISAQGLPACAIGAVIFQSAVVPVCRPTECTGVKRPADRGQIIMIDEGGFLVGLLVETIHEVVEPGCSQAEPFVLAERFSRASREALRQFQCPAEQGALTEVPLGKYCSAGMCAPQLSVFFLYPNDADNMVIWDREGEEALSPRMLNAILERLDTDMAMMELRGVDDTLLTLEFDGCRRCMIRCYMGDRVFYFDNGSKNEAPVDLLLGVCPATWMLCQSTEDVKVIVRHFAKTGALHERYCWRGQP